MTNLPTVFSHLAQICFILCPFNNDFVVVILFGCTKDLFAMYSCNYEFERSAFSFVVSLPKVDRNIWKPFLLIYFILAVLGLSCGKWDLSSLTKSRTWAHCIARADSYPLDHQEIPHENFLIHKFRLFFH